MRAERAGWRKESEESGYEPLSDTKVERHLEDIVGWVRSFVAHTFGSAGMQHIDHTVWEHLGEMVEDACRDSHHEGWQMEKIEQGREANRRTGAMVATMLECIGSGRDETETKIRVLAAHAGVDLAALDAEEEKELQE